MPLKIMVEVQHFTCHRHIESNRTVFLNLAFSQETLKRLLVICHVPSCQIVHAMTISDRVDILFHYLLAVCHSERY